MLLILLIILLINYGSCYRMNLSRMEGLIASDIVYETFSEDSFDDTDQLHDIYQRDLKLVSKKDNIYPTNLKISFVSFNKTYILELQLNRNLLKPSGSTVQVLKRTSGDDIMITSKKLSNHRYYHGSVLEMEPEIKYVGWAGLYVDMISNPNSIALEGTVTISKEFYNIKSTSSNDESDFSSWILNSQVEQLIQKTQDNASFILADANETVISKKICGCCYSDVEFDVVNDQYLPNFKSKNAQKHQNDSLNSSFQTHSLFPRDTSQAELLNIMQSVPIISKAISMGLDCPIEPQMLYVGVVADCTYSEKYNNDLSKIESSILGVWNIVSRIYQITFNIQIGISTILITSDCFLSGTSNSIFGWNRPCDPAYMIIDRLSDFSKWRGAQNDDSGLWFLLTKCPSYSTVGMAWTGQVCNRSIRKQSNGYVSGTAVISDCDNMYVVIAHELGHSFGAIHDCDRNTCAILSSSKTSECCACEPECDCKAKYIMHPEDTNFTPSEFSYCSMKDICQRIPYVGTCLQSPGSKPVKIANICGNGIREFEEECDCGNEEQCKSDACCQSNCKLKPGAQCSDKNDVCCSQCKIIPAEQQKICLSKHGDCQIDSICDGKSSECPSRRNLLDGTICKYDKNTNQSDITKCASGICTSRDIQCKVVGSRYNMIGSCIPPSRRHQQCHMYCLQQSGQCVDLNTIYIDGTPCNEGFCRKGKCTNSGSTIYINPFITLFIIPIIFV